MAPQRAESNAGNTRFRNFKVSLNETISLLVAPSLVGPAVGAYYIADAARGRPITMNHT